MKLDDVAGDEVTDEVDNKDTGSFTVSVERLADVQTGGRLELHDLLAPEIAFLTNAFTTSTLSRLRASGCASRTARLAASCARASLGA